MAIQKWQHNDAQSLTFTIVKDGLQRALRMESIEQKTLSECIIFNKVSKVSHTYCLGNTQRLLFDR